MPNETVRAAVLNLVQVLVRVVVARISGWLPALQALQARLRAPAMQSEKSRRRDGWAPVSLPAPRLTDMGLAESTSVVPPNVERAIRAVLSTGGRLTLNAVELERFLRGLGLHRGDARGVVMRSTARLGRSQFAAGDLEDVQDLVTRTWIDGHARCDHEAFLSRLGLELGVDLRIELDAAALREARTRVVQALVARGWSGVAAQAIVEHALGRAASVLAVIQGAERSCAA